MKKWFMAVIVLCLLSAPAMAEVKMQEVTYKVGDQSFNGYLAYDDAIEGRRPGVLVVHEWWGYNDYSRRRAVMLAELGYAALALDMYGDGKVAEHPDDAGAFAGEVNKNMDVAKERFLAALEVLKEQPQTDPGHIAAIGYCFGGGVVLNMARMGVDLDGVVSFHGSLASNVQAQPGDVKAAVLVEHGADDTFATPETIQAFKDEMVRLGVNYAFDVYPGAKHSFTNPEADRLAEEFSMSGVGYNEEADQKSWQAMQDFFKKVFSN